MLQKFKKEILAAIRGEKYARHGDGVISLFNDGLICRGMFEEGVNGGDFRRHPNLIVDQGIVHILNVVLGSTNKISTWYLAPFTGSTAILAALTAATFTANETESTSGSEGYSESVRQTATFVNATSADQIDNYGAKAAFTIVTATSVTMTGIGLLSVNTKGGTTGVLLSASKFAAGRVLQNADVWNAGYRVTLAGS